MKSRNISELKTLCT